jgi:hypothetical protein
LPEIGNFKQTPICEENNIANSLKEKEQGHRGTMADNGVAGSDSSTSPKKRAREPEDEIAHGTRDSQIDVDSIAQTLFR